ncbi:6441_t:CDS:2 [Rhizophagus irregularis]|nr:6441_t:CDS:2 [Rhizophagus irregularis]
MDSNSHVPKIEQDIILREFYYTPSGLYAPRPMYIQYASLSFNNITVPNVLSACCEGCSSYYLALTDKLSTHMAKAETIKKKVYAKSSCKYNRPICFDKPRLSYNDNVRYLFDHSEL